MNNYDPLEVESDEYQEPRHHNENLVFFMDSVELDDIQEKVWKLTKREEESYEDYAEKMAFFIDLAGFQMATKQAAGSSNAMGNEYIKNSGTAELFSSALGETQLSIVNSVVSRFFDEEEFVDVTTSGPLSTPPKPDQQQALQGQPGQQQGIDPNQPPQPSIDEIVEGIKYRVKKWYQVYFTYVLKDFKEDMKKTLMWATSMGSTTRKVFFDPIRGIPSSNFIPPSMLLRNNTFDSFFKNSEHTHKYYLTKDEIQLRIDSGFWSKAIGEAESESDSNIVDVLEEKVLSLEGRNPETNSYDYTDDKQRYAIYERYMYLDIEGSQTPCIVTFSKNGNLGAIYRNCDENDPLRLPIPHFIDYEFLPSYEGTSMGLANVAGQNARAATVIERRLIDASIAAAFPPTFIKPNAKFQKHNFEMAPGKATTLPVGDDDISKSITFAPVAAPNPFMADLKKDLEDSIKKYSLLVSQDMMDLAQRAPQGSVLAMLSRIEELPNSIIQGFYDSFAREISIFKRMFYEWLPSDNSPFTVTINGEQLTVYRNDFCDFVKVLPACGYSKQSDAYKFMRSEIISQQAQHVPQIHDMRAVMVHFYKEMGLASEEIDKLLPIQQPPQPADIILNEAKQLPQVHDMRSVLGFYYQSKGIPEEIIKAVLPEPAPPEQQPQPIDPGIVGMAEVEAQKQIAELNAQVKMAQIEVDREGAQARLQIDVVKIELAREKQEKEAMESQMKMIKDQHHMEMEEKNLELKEKEVEIDHLKYLIDKGGEDTPSSPQAD